ncbi:putative hydrophobin [Lyophyllum shimeji]|uniref:Hydrophobin n=1 Tax=Lyophyllum shimeji TaxID=47721 RepID=A0A9P3PVI4_LYOSH|nr:putative hydrophobin [Lyophyllum shimeji]
MFSRVSTLFLFFVFALCASASVLPRTGGDPPAGQCNTGSIQCCNSVQQAGNPVVGILSGLLGVVLPSLTGQVGLNCSPLNVIGIGGNSCNAQPVCCTGNNFSGLLVLGCTPINLNL